MYASGKAIEWRLTVVTRLSQTAATLHVRDTGTCLLVWWETATPDLFQSLRASFDATVPRRGEATWQRDAGAWSVAYRYQRRLNKWIARTFEPRAVQWEQGAVDDHADGARRPRETAVDLMAAYEELHLLPNAPPELVTAAYRCLAQRYHPDRGGDDAAMVRLNAAVACIRTHQATSPRRE